MKVIENILYLEVDDTDKCGLGNANYIYKEKSRGAKWGTFIKDRVYKNKVLIEFETLHPKKKELVIKYFGNPYDYYAKEPIRRMVVKDLKAEDFYLNYRYDEEKSLTPENISKYTTAASWLKMLMNVQSDFKSIKKQLCISVAKFWINVGEIIEQDGIALPSNYKRLLEKIENYKANGYETLIHKLFGKKSNARKIDDELSETILIELISMPNADDVMTSRRYNKWAAENSKEQITARTVTNWKNDNKHLITLEKYGTAINYNTYGKHIIRKRPSAPNLCWEHDDNELDLYFQSSGFKGKIGVYYFNRFVIAVVIDTFNDYISGWAIAKTYTKDLIRLAYLDAVHHVKDLTGNFYLPYQIRSDRFGLDAKAENDLGQFYKSLAIFTPATVKVARSKYIERSFGDHWHQALSCYKNYAGTNITSKHHLSEDFRDANKKDYPTIEQASAQIAQFIEVMRHLVNEKTGLSRQEEWLKAFNENEKSKQKPISEIQMLVKLGTPHSHQNKITNRGITLTINCIERTYEIPEPYFLQTVGSTVQVIYDPLNYNRILVTDNQNLLFIAKEQEAMPSAIADYQPGDREKINRRLAEKVRHMETINAAKDNREDTIRLNKINIEGLLMAGVHSKAMNHQALVEYGMVNHLEEPIKRNKKQLPQPAKSIEDMLDEM